MRNYRKIQSLISTIRVEGATQEVLKQMVLLLADEIIDMQREIDRVNAVATRADRNTRVGIRR